MTTVIARFVDCFSPLTKNAAYNLKISGIDGAIRYLGYYTHPEWGKGTSKEEAQTILTEHLAFLPVWEGSNATAASFFTHQQGVLDGGQALQEAESIGYPTGKPIFFAVDFEAQARDVAAIQTIIDGAKKSLAGKYKVGIYGGISVIDGITADKYWQTIAWSAVRSRPAPACSSRRSTPGSWYQRGHQ